MNKTWPKSLEYERGILVAGRLRPTERRIAGGWRSPTKECQLTFFPVDEPTALAEAGVSCDDLKRWTEAGWLSGDLLQGRKYDNPQLLELAFIRDIARSGLSDAQINSLLAQLSKPYYYDSYTIAYSFLYGWVRLPIFFEEKQIHEILDDFIEQWIQDTSRTDPDRLDYLRILIVKALDSVSNADTGEDPDDANDGLQEDGP